ncbi:hypothetical protein FACS189496_3430 [Bacilli bacterium]|nr:hypothetical protein FACS189496_3430 [Bacilli bacterium]
MKIKNIIKKIKQEISYYDKVSLFIHKKPDGDTLGGCFGFKYFLENIYPKKDIRIVCLNTEQIPFNDIFKNDFKIADKNFIKDSIGFLIDIPNKMQLPTEEYLLCKFLVRIDHHIYTEKFGDFE